MEEKPVRKTNWLGIISLCLGIIAVLTSFLFIVLISAVSEDLYRLILPFLSVAFVDDIGDYQSSFWLSNVIGIIGLMLGLISYPKKAKLSGRSKAGVFLNLLALVGGLPLFILLWTIGPLFALVVLIVIMILIWLSL